MDEVTDEPLYRDRVCGIDIGKAGMAATIRVPSDKNPARRAQETREFGTTKREVLALADWLRCWQVPAVVLEATGDYWKPVFYRLEAEGFECVLADARQVKNLPGRAKRDPSDSRSLAACFERGSVTGCFVATPEFRLIREHTRYRRDLTADRTRQKQRAEKLLESAAIKISSVESPTCTWMTGRDIMAPPIAGEPGTQGAGLARGRRVRIGAAGSEPWMARSSSPASTPPAKAMLGRIDRIDADRRISRHRPAGPEGTAAGRVEPYESPGLRPRPAACLQRRAEHQRSIVLPPDRPRRRQVQARHLHRREQRRTIAARQDRHQEGARCRHRPPLRPGQGQRGPGQHPDEGLLRLLSRPGMRYADLGSDYYDQQRAIARPATSHVGKLACLGYEVTLSRPAPALREPPKPADHPETSADGTNRRRCRRAR